MTDYVKSTNFASKDALSTGNPLKIVKGTEIDTEFTNIATAVATKADLLSPVFSGTPTAPTASTGTTNTQLATTAFVAAALQTLYPVGSVYINAGVSTNPATLLGFGTWTAFGAGRVPVGLNASDALFDTLEETGGSKDSIVVEHTHTATSAGSHQHFEFSAETVVESGTVSNTTSVARNATQGGSTYESYELRPGTVDATVGLSSTAGSHTHTISSTGSSGTNTNLQPYITVAMWNIQVKEQGVGSVRDRKHIYLCITIAINTIEVIIRRDSLHRRRRTNEVLRHLFRCLRIQESTGGAIVDFNNFETRACSS